MQPSNDTSGALVLGIDTGGTYTDAVLLRYDTRTVLASHKSLTTRRDLSIGVEEVISHIPLVDPSAIKMVSISTTLATNAIAEGKSKRVVLFLIGYDPELVRVFKMEARFATPHFYYVAGGHDLHGREKDALDLQTIRDTVHGLKDQVDAVAVSSYFSPLNPEHENRAHQTIAEICDLPVVLGHHLSTRLGSVERATTAALNASLLAGLRDFVAAVRRAMRRRQIEAPLMVVRGDGTLMSAQFAERTPVETIHSGPAASAIGGRFLSGLDNALVIDIGGTTTDIALIRDAQVAIHEQGATVNDYKTAVRAANIFTIGLGGDSRIALSPDGGLRLGPERVVPLAYLARQHPDIQASFKTLARQMWSPMTPDWLEYWFLLHEPRDARLCKTSRETALIEFLRDGPKPVSNILKHFDVLHVTQLGAGTLVQREIIGKAALTPTDLLHVDGRFASWDAQASKLALEVFCRTQALDRDTLCRKVWAHMTETIARAIIIFLSGKAFGPRSLPDNDMGRWFLSNSIYPTHPQLETSFRLRIPVIGIGAPAKVFLKDVAIVLHTDLILPEHYEVANAVGAVAGAVMSCEEVLVYPRMSSAGLEVLGYYVQSSNGRRQFEDVSDALAHARALSRERSIEAALRSGADNPHVVVTEQANGLDTYRVRAEAMGNPRLVK